MDSQLFVLAGNGPYSNRGCEAITRGTIEILRHYFKEPSFLSVSSFNNKIEFYKQASDEIDSSLTHKMIQSFPERRRCCNPSWWALKIANLVMPHYERRFVWKDLIPYLSKSRAVLSVGGDNYSLDYGIPKLFLSLDDVVMSSGKKLIIWGASVGPFRKKPKFERFIARHLSGAFIFVRESYSFEYLRGIGLKDNVFLVADPAFMLNPTKPEVPFHIDPLGIGVNLSPMIANFGFDGNLPLWVNRAVAIVKQIAVQCKRPIYLVSHVTSSGSNDFDFLFEVNKRLGLCDVPVILIPNQYNASELKYLISRLSLFIGARTHSTIAALSSGVPTISVSYSIKAKGINQDIFGDLDYLIDSTQLIPELISERVKFCLENLVSIKAEIDEVMPRIKSLSLDSGRVLKQIL